MQKSKNKLFIHSMKILLPNFDKTFYLNIVVNENKTFKTKNFDFKKNSNLEINQTFELEGIENIEIIRFQIYEKSTIFSNALFKGEVNKANLLKDDHNNLYIAYLSSPKQENCAVVYYDLDLINNNFLSHNELIDTYDTSLKNLEDEKSSRLLKSKNKSFLGNLKDLASADNPENFTRFVHNMEYIKTIKHEVINIINWKNYWKTLALLFIISYTILHIKLFFICLPVIFIYFHVRHKDKMDKFSHKNTRSDNLENLALITKSIDVFNKFISFYENGLEILQHSDKKIYEEIYFNLIKLIIWNFFIIYFNLIRIQLYIIAILWIVVLTRNPPFMAFIIFMTKFVYNKFFDNLPKYNFIDKIKKYTTQFLFQFIPFFELAIRVHNIRNSNEKINSKNISVLFAKNNSEMNEERRSLSKSNSAAIIPQPSFNNLMNDFDVNSGDTIKYELFENERWWMFVGWAKNLILNERPLWSDILGKKPLDKNMCLLPENFQWESEWKVEVNNNTDDQGWEYSSDFNSQFVAENIGKYVRRRKWIRTAIKKK